VKRVDLVRHLRKQGCQLLREGAKHSVFINPRSRRVSTVPRHREINDYLALKICRDLDVPDPAS
jgi:mRNA interferase HicA